MLAVAGEADAQSRICRQLESQLAEVGRAGGSGGASAAEQRRYDRAIAAQEQQLAKARRQANRSSCNFFDRGRASCSGDDLVRRMERNLSSLERKRAGLSGGGSGNARRERARLVSALNANGCRNFDSPSREVRYERREQGRNFFERLFGGGNRYEEYQPVPDQRERVRSAPAPRGSGISGGGSFRTLCVRTCDGYYWPISYSSSRSDFQRDEQNCQTMCPGSEVKLFSHRVPDTESEAMTDALGNPYTDLPNAFKYREASFKRPDSCSCAVERKNFTLLGNGSTPLEPAQKQDSLPLPAPRPDPLADPETQANRDGNFDPTMMRKLISPNTAAIGDERKVRVVGPAYLPDQQEAAGPQVPARTAVQ
ncbi:MAG: DUF2865 domain-containing protein [Mesorhizobium sp.]